MNPQSFILDGRQLDLDHCWRIALRSASCSFDEEALARVTRAREFVDALVNSGEVVYGITTGFGKLKNVRIAPVYAQELQRSLLRSHAVGMGEDAPPEVVRLMLLLRANALLQGASGIREETLALLLELLRRDILPRVPMKGSVGASGDLAPLSHLALALIGEGEVDHRGERKSAAQALAEEGLEAVALQPKEGLALINGTQFSAAVGLMALRKAWMLAKLADLACAMTLEGLMGSLSPFDARVAALRPHPGHAAVAENVRRLLDGSEILASHAECDRVQDPYSLRCVPQVQGAARDALTHLGEVLRRELNSVTDNPLLFPEEGDAISAGNFHAEPLALPLDYATLAAAELASISERRLEQLVNPDLNDLPAFLAGGRKGVNSGLMIVQVLAAALVSENKGLAHPASVDSIPTSANQEDHVSMAPIAARQLDAVCENGFMVLAAELLGAFFALHHRRPLRAGAGVEAAFACIAKVVDPPGDDRAFKNDLDRILELVRSGRLLAAVEKVTGPLAGPDPLVQSPEA